MVGWQTATATRQETATRGVTTACPHPPRRRPTTVELAGRPRRGAGAGGRAAPPRHAAGRRAARGMSLFGEHAAGWLALGAARRARRPAPPPRVAHRDRRRRRARTAPRSPSSASCAAPVPTTRGSGARRHAQPAELPVLARHLHHRRRPAYGGSSAAGSPPVLVPPDGAVAAGPGRALPDRRAGGRPAGRRRRRRDAPASRKVPAMTDIEVPAAPVAPARTPLGVARGVLKTMRPRQWVKNVLVLAAPFAGGDLFDPGDPAGPRCSRSSRSRSRRRGSTWSTTPRTSRPTARTRPSGSGRSRPVSCRRGSPSASRSCCSRRAGGEPARVGAAADRARPCTSWCSWPTASGSSTSRARHLHRRVGLPAAGHRGRRGHGHPAVAVVPAGGGLRVAVHGGRQALRRDDARRAAPARRSASRWSATRQPTCGSCGRSRRRS